MRVENMIFSDTESCFDDVLVQIKKYINPCYNAVDLEAVKEDLLNCSWVCANFCIFSEIWAM